MEITAVLTVDQRVNILLYSSYEGGVSSV